MKITKNIATALIIISISLFPRLTPAAHGVLFDKIMQLQSSQGKDKTREIATNLGILVREERGTFLLPVIIDRTDTSNDKFSVILKALGGRVDANSRSYTRLLVPLSRLQQFASAFPGQQLRTSIPVRPAFGLGSIVSESVFLTSADGYQAGNLTGKGVKVAIVDLGFIGLANAIAAGELPVNTVNFDFTGTGIETGTKHGVGVSEHAADIAPDIELHCLKVGDEVDLQNAADYIRNNNIRIANHSVAWAIASYYDDSGPINAAINDSYDNDDVFWTVASGNSAKQHWRGTWSDSNVNNVLEFSGSDEWLGLSATGGTFTVFLNWDQYGTGNKTNLNLYLVDKNGTAVAGSTAGQLGSSDPAEGLSYTYNSNEQPYSIVVTRAGGGSASGLDITLFSFNHNFSEYKVAGSSLMDPANAHGAFTVGAVKQTNWQNSNPAIRGYSSRGPTNDGRLKPDIVAPDGTASLTYGASSSGTSFSSPTTAGAAALLLEENPALNAVSLRNKLISEAIDVGAAGLDNTYGAGKLQLPLIDSDDDGLTNVEEILLGTDALDADTDNDGLTDFEEDRTYNTNPLASDTDGDGLNDYEEVMTYGTNPLASNRGDLAPYSAPNDTVDIGDYLVLTRLVLGEITATSTDLALGDLNNNGSLDAGDLVLLMRVIRGEIPAPSP